MHHICKPREGTVSTETKASHQARKLAKLTSEIFLHGIAKVYLLDTYTYEGKQIAMVSAVDDERIYEVEYDALSVV